jgi:uncharacterized lipoprotein YmbA
MRLNRSYLTEILLFLSFVFLGGCLGGGTQKPTDYYLLQPFRSAMAEQGAAAGEGIVLGIGPVRMQEYLNRPQIVTRTSTSEINLHEFHYWGEPLSTNFTVVLAQNLSALLSTDRIFIFPYRNKQTLPLQYQVVVEVIRFDGEPGVEASLLAQYSILQFQENGMKELVTRQPSFSKPLADKSYKTLVATMSELVADLSRQIAGEIKAASAK